MRAWFCIAANLLLCGMASAATPAIFYVRVSGSDQADGLTPGTAFATIGRGASAITNAGDRVIVGPGTYPEGNIAPPPRLNGIEGRPIVFIADTTGGVTGDPPAPVVIAPPSTLDTTTGFLLLGRHFIVIDGFTILGAGAGLGASDAGIQVRPSPDGVDSGSVTIRNVTIANGMKRGIDVTANMTVDIEGCFVHDNGSVGISVSAPTPAGAVVQIANNQVHDNGSHGIFVEHAIGGTIENNVLQRNMDDGILLRSSDGVSIAANTVSASGMDGIAAGAGAELGIAVSNIRISDNRVDNTQQAGIDVVATGTALVQRNVVNDSGATAISLSGDSTTAATLDSNVVTVTHDAGMLVTGGEVVTLTANQIDASGAAGLDVRDGNHVAILGNQVTSSSAAGVSVIASGDVQAASNDITQSGSVGMSIAASTTGTVALAAIGNSIVASESHGIFADGVVGGAVGLNTTTGNGGDGILLRHSSNVAISANQVRTNHGGGIEIGDPMTPAAAAAVRRRHSRRNAAVAVVIGANLVVTDNNVAANTGPGIRLVGSAQLSAERNTVMRSGTGGLSIDTQGAAATLTVVGNTVGSSGADGIFLQGGTSGVVRNNLSLSNAATGLTLRDAAQMLIANNLIYANTSDGIAIGTAEEASPNATVISNTVYANGAHGLVIGSTIASSSGATVLNNIFQANAGTGIAVSETSTEGYVSGFNVDPDRYESGTRHNTYDIIADALFVNPAGADAALGGDMFADDNFRLQQRRGGQNQNSPAVDAGSASAAAIGLGGSTASGDALDIGVVDIGYHYETVATATVSVPTPFMPFFVRQGGDDGNNGHTPAQAFASIQGAVNSNANQAVAGATVIVGPGRYAEGNISLKNGGGRLSIQGDASGMMTGDLPGVVLVDAGEVTSICGLASPPPPPPCDTGFVLQGGGPVSLSGFHVTGAVSAGIQVRAGGDNALIHDNVAFSNQDRGIEVLGADAAEIRNNLVYANGTGGIQVSQSTGSSVINNTVYGNVEDGVLIGGPTDVEAAPRTSVLRNVVANNGTEIKVEVNSQPDYVTGFNVVFGPTPFSGNTPRADSDFIADPLFVDPAGSDGMLGGPNFLDDDFRLAQTEAAFSPAVDIDFGSMNVLAAGSTRSDGLPDIGPADAGYHYPFLPLATAVAAVPHVVFVRSTGVDTNTGASADQALATVGKALAAVADGGFIVVGPGTYRESGLHLNATGQDALAVVFGDPDGAFTGDTPGEVVVDAGGSVAPIVTGPVVIDGLRLTGAGGIGLRVLHTAHSVVIRNTTICGNGRSGLVTNGDGVEITNNLVCSNGGVGITVWLRRGRAPTRLLNNTVADNRLQGIAVSEIGGRGAYAMVYNNVVSGNGKAGITFLTLQNPQVGSNLNTDGYGRGTTPGMDDVASAPGFVGAGPSPAVSCPTTEAFRVGSDSAAINAGRSSAIEIGLQSRSVRADDATDDGPTDLGFHYPQLP